MSTSVASRKKPARLSPGVELLKFHLNALQITGWVNEYRFCERMWRFDFAFPELKIAVEIEGGIHISGRHNRGKGMEEDMEKYNRAAVLGWTVLRYSTGMVEEGVAMSEIRDLLREVKAA
jgi:very-short-patch-repair endonuclease